jgi:adenine-specific DNA-methyltransferase
MSSKQHAESRFVELMTELFQLDEAESLDFGIYRVIKRHNREVREFLGEIVTENEQKCLKGGRLSEILESSFADADAETTADDKYRLIQLEKDLNLKLGMSPEEREIQLATLEKIPATAQMVAEYRSRKEQMASASTAIGDRTEVLNRLYQFFARHYQDGDFIVERRYGRDGSRYIRSTGEDTEFHWATEDMYYIKSGDIFTDFPVKLSKGQRVVFAVDQESLQKTRTELKPSDKAHYELDTVTKNDDSQFRVCLKYLKNGQTDKQKEEIVTAAQKACGGDSAELKRWLGHFIARNQSDFFIHKRLKEALSEDLNIFIKTEILDADQLLAGGDLPKRIVKVARIVREVGRQIIDFLAALEDFQKGLWEKKKFVFATRYIITLDRLERYCPEWLAKNIDVIVDKQRQEWNDLGLGDYANPPACVRKTEGDLITAATEQYLPLPVDTLNFNSDFVWTMLEATTATISLDGVLDGVAIQSDNWQALNTLQVKYRNSIQSLYADPPYNTDAGPISYKNGYRKASWAAFIQNRLALVHNYLLEDGVACITIDDFQKNELLEVVSREFGSENFLGTVVIKNSPSGRPSVKGFRVSHEYAIFSGISPRSNIGLLERSESQAAHFGNQDEDGPFAWENFRKRGGATTHRSARPKQYYPIYVENDKIRIPKIEWQKDKKEWKVIDAPNKEEVVLYPVNDDGTERVWSWGHLTAILNMKDLEVRRSPEGIVSVFRKVRPLSEGSLPSTVWSKAEHSAVEYGSVLLKNMFNKREFSFPKSVHAVADCLVVSGAHEDALVLDIFAGSGTTAHAVINLNNADDGSRKFLIIETNNYINSFTIPRILKTAAASTWSGGKADILDGPGIFLKVQFLEQYEDTLENLDTDIDQQTELPFDDPAFTLRYRLDRATRHVFSSIDLFSSPFGYKLKRSEGGGEAKSQQVDLVESLIYLLGLNVDRLYREPEGVVITGHDRLKRSVAVFFRDCSAADTATWAEAKLSAHPAVRILTNDPASMTFAGCERFEAIESIFATQFGRA